jgi:hypothetical protein
MTAAAAAPIDPAHVDTTSTEAALAAAAGAEKAVVAAVPAPKAPEPVKPPEAKPTEPKEPAGQAFARIARAERSRVEKELAFKAEMEAARAQVAAEKAEAQRLRDEAQAIRDAEARAKADPTGYLEKLYGPTWYETITEAKLSGKAPPDLAVRAIEEKLDGRIAAFRKEQDELRRKEAEQRAAAEKAERERVAAEQKALIEQFHADTVAFVKAHPDDYELTHLYDAFDLVPEVIQETFRTSKRVLSEKEAADLVEKHFEEQLERAVTTTKKIGPRFVKAEPPKVVEESAKPTPTLSNATAAAPAFTGPPKTEEERIARAVAAYEAAQAKTRTA